jgi:nicotinate-nucleotide adenylyltransferase
MNETIGLFGGTFDPPHRGHLALADRVYRQLQLERLLWVVTPDPPHKPGGPVAAARHRLAMTRLAVRDTPYEVSEIEFERPGPQYALDTVRAIAGRHPGAKLVYIMGGDSLADLPKWHRPAELVAALACIAVMRRPGDTLDLTALEAVLPGLTARLRFVEAPPVEIASREIRRRIAARETVQDWVLPAVSKYIAAHRLYSA